MAYNRDEYEDDYYSSEERNEGMSYDDYAEMREIEDYGSYNEFPDDND